MRISFRFNFFARQQAHIRRAGVSSGVDLRVRVRIRIRIVAEDASDNIRTNAEVKDVVQANTINVAYIGAVCGVELYVKAPIKLVVLFVLVVVVAIVVVKPCCCVMSM